MISGSIEVNHRQVGSWSASRINNGLPALYEVMAFVEGDDGHIYTAEFQWERQGFNTTAFGFAAELMREAMQHLRRKTTID